MNKYRILSVGVLAILFVLLIGGNSLMAQTCVVVKDASCCAKVQQKDCCPQGQSADCCKDGKQCSKCSDKAATSPGCQPGQTDCRKAEPKAQSDKDTARPNATTGKSSTGKSGKLAKSGS